MPEQICQRNSFSFRKTLGFLGKALDDRLFVARLHKLRYIYTYIFLNFSSQRHRSILFVAMIRSLVNAVVSVVVSLCYVFSFTSSMACQRCSILCRSKNFTFPFIFTIVARMKDCSWNSKRRGYENVTQFEIFQPLSLSRIFMHFYTYFCKISSRHTHIHAHRRHLTCKNVSNIQRAAVLVGISDKVNF